jgi:hypothetical protein
MIFDDLLADIDADLEVKTRIYTDANKVAKDEVQECLIVGIFECQYNRKKDISMHSHIRMASGDDDQRTLPRLDVPRIRVETPHTILTDVQYVRILHEVAGWQSLPSYLTNNKPIVSHLEQRQLWDHRHWQEGTRNRVACKVGYVMIRASR